jgi:uncharacterized membrane protein
VHQPQTEKVRQVDTGLRSIIKAVVWQLMGIIVMLTISFILTGSLGLGGAIALLNAAVGLLTYLIYERVWDRISWGRAGVSQTRPPAAR